MNALVTVLVVSTTALLSVVFGVFGAYYSVNFILTAVNPSQPAPVALRTLVPQQSRMSGD